MGPSFSPQKGFAPRISFSRVVESIRSWVPVQNSRPSLVISMGKGRSKRLTSWGFGLVNMVRPAALARVAKVAQFPFTPFALKARWQNNTASEAAPVPKNMPWRGLPSRGLTTRKVGRSRSCFASKWVMNRLGPAVS